MEFKTCEERVLWELNEAENETAHQAEVIRRLNVKIGDLQTDLIDLKEIILSLSTYKEFEYSPTVIMFNTLYDNWDEDRFRRLLEIIPEIKESKK